MHIQILSLNPHILFNLLTRCPVCMKGIDAMHTLGLHTVHCCCVGFDISEACNMQISTLRVCWHLAFFPKLISVCIHSGYTSSCSAVQNNFLITRSEPIFIYPLLWVDSKNLSTLQIGLANLMIVKRTGWLQAP